MVATPATDLCTGAIPVACRQLHPLLEGATATGVLWQAAPGRFLLDAPGVARFLVANGVEITVDPEPGASSLQLARHLRMAPLAALFYQRGILACRAAVVSTTFPDGMAGAVMITGASGTGKSSLAAALLNRGCHLIADGVAAIDLDARGNPVVLPLETELRLWPDAVALLFPEGVPGWAREAECRPGGPRYFEAPRHSSTGPIPLRAIYSLWYTQSAPPPSVEPNAPDVTGLELFAAAHYNHLIADVLLYNGRFRQIARAISREVRAERLIRPENEWRAEVFADAILEDRDG